MRFFVDGFKKARPEVPMHFDRASDDLFGESDRCLRT